MSFYCFPIKLVSEMIGNAVQKSQSSLRTIISTVQISLRFSDTPLRVACLQIFSMIRGLSPSRKSEKRVFYEIVWTSVEGHFTHWKKRTRFFQNKRIYTNF